MSDEPRKYYVNRQSLGRDNATPPCEGATLERDVQFSNNVADAWYVLLTPVELIAFLEKEGRCVVELDIAPLEISIWDTNSDW